MTLAISATYTLTGGYYVPGYQIVVSGLSGVANAATVLVQRRELVSGETTDVRGIANTAVTSDSATATDFEYHYYSDNNGFVYDCYVYNAGGTQLATVTSTPTLFGIQTRTALEASYPWSSAVIQSIQQPALSLPLVISDFSAWTVPGRVQSINYVLGRSRPVVLTDTMGGKTGTFKVIVNTALNGVTHELFKTLYEYNDTFLFQPYYKSSGVFNFYFKIQGVTISRQTIAESVLESARAGTTSLTYDIDFIEVDRPIASSAPVELISWQDVKNNSATWQTVKDNHPTWLDVLNNPTT